MARKKNPRTVAVALLADLKRTADAMRSRWTFMATRLVYETGTVRDASGREYSNATTRPRTAEEYPESQAAEWSRMWAAADDMETQARALKELALTQWQSFGDNAQYVLERKSA